jgi:hypothetical protein
MPTFRCTVRIDSALQGTPAYNIWHLRASDLYASQNEVGNALTALRTFYTTVRAWMPSSCNVTVPFDLVMHQSDYVPVTGGTDEAVVFTPVSAAGTGGTSYAPAPTAGVVSWATTIRSRAGRGRTFLGPLNAAAMYTDGTIHDTMRTAVDGAAAALISAGSGPDGWSWGVYSRTQNIIRDFRTGKMSDKVAVLRSRRD